MYLENFWSTLHKIDINPYHFWKLCLPLWAAVDYTFSVWVYWRIGVYCVLWEYLLYTAHRLVHGQQQRRWFSSRDDMKNDAAFSLRLDNFQVQPKQVSTSRLTRINFSPATNYLSWKIIPHIIHSNLDIVNKSVRPFLFTILNYSTYQMWYA